MSILNVEHLSHGFGDRAIFQDVSFRLLKGEHIGLVGANGEGKSTFMNIITGKLMPDEGKVEWAKNVNVGYLDQHTVLEKGMTIREVLKSAFGPLFEMEANMNAICDRMGEASEEEMNEMMEELGTIQDLLMAHDFYIIDSKVDEVGRALGLDEIGMERDVTELSGGQRTKVLLGKLLLQKPDILLLDEPTNYLDVQHIEWLKRYLLDYENAFILIPMISRFKQRYQSGVPYGKPETGPLCGRLRQIPGGLCGKEGTAGGCLQAPAAGNRRAGRLCGPQQGPCGNPEYGHVPAEEAG